MDKYINELEFALQWLQAGQSVVVATVNQTWGSSPRPVGSHMVINSQGDFMGSVSGGCVEGAVIQEALSVLESGKFSLLNFSVSNEQAWEVGLSCGGQIEVVLRRWHSPELVTKAVAYQKANIAFALVIDLDNGQENLLAEGCWLDATCPLAENQPLDEIVLLVSKGVCQMRVVADRKLFISSHRPTIKLLIVGAVHIAQALAPMAQLVGIKVTLIDPRELFARDQRFAGQPVINQWPDEVMSAQDIGADTAIVTLTHDPKIDDPALEIALNSRAFYIGALGSKRTHQQRLERLAEKGLEQQATRIKAPIGLGLGGRAPEEIAVAIMAQIIQQRYR